MNEELDLLMSEAEDGMKSAIERLNLELTKIRAGRATPSMLDTVKVDYYGSQTPISQVGNISTLDSKTLSIQPWEKGILDEIARGIINANLGLNPQNNGELIIISVPTLTEERRIELVKRAKAEGENAKVRIRSERKDANDFIKSLKNDGLSEDQSKSAEDEVQDLTNSYTNQIDTLVDLKEVDIMKV
ncbi:ribosome recycling factor [Flavobacteriales bacterium]|jgi:ribosome recycling factor|nr:ribosome recycling factor [Flavobacteriales bacterium]